MTSEIVTAASPRDSRGPLPIRHISPFRHRRLAKGLSASIETKGACSNVFLAEARGPFPIFFSERARWACLGGAAEHLVVEPGGRRGTGGEDAPISAQAAEGGEE
eukprot:scaffold16109_cov84-Isochrysis_galbana.AAC.1